jgi:hypothetical protein
LGNRRWGVADVVGGHHASNVLAKLGLRNRAEAAAFARSAAFHSS